MNGSHGFFAPLRPLSFALVLGLFIASCGPLEDPRSLFAADLKPPSILEARTTDSRGFVIMFDEEVRLYAENLHAGPGLSLDRVEGRGRAAILHFTEEQSPGRAYLLTGTVGDAWGNNLRFRLAFSGHNPRLPKILINEFRTDSSKGKCDLVEFLALEDGNAAGAVFHAGTAEESDFSFVFPSLEVKKADFLILHLKPSSDPGARDEAEAKNESAGLEASGSAWDLWAKDEGGLSKYNGVLSLYACDNGEILDSVFYTNRTSSSDTNYGGFGSRALRAQVGAISSAGHWKTKDGTPSPEDGVSSSSITSARSLCRSPLGADTDSKEDWHLVPTKGSSFGAENSDAVYAGENVKSGVSVKSPVRKK